MVTYSVINSIIALGSHFVWVWLRLFIVGA